MVRLLIANRLLSDNLMSMIKNFASQPCQALQHSEHLVAIIKQEILCNGPITFARFMELALYAPGLGYYAAGLQKFGREGDFTTAPEISALYSYCLAKQCQQILINCPGDILEFGAGTGIMAADILLRLEELGTLPNHYYILEISADLKERQRNTINARAPHLRHKVKWLKTLKNFALQGVMIANEVLDAFPVHRFCYDNATLYEFFVVQADNDFAFELKTPTTSLKQHIQNINIDFSDGYESECNLLILGWLQSLSEVLRKGVLLLIDYGFPRHEYYHPDRNRGTLMCHYHHHAHDNPLIQVGMQDITAHVDFTCVAEAGVCAGMSLLGFTNQANFLLSCGMIQELQRQPEEQYSKLANEVKVLTSPNEMGELFKVMALTKNLNTPLLGFSLRNMCERL